MGLMGTLFSVLLEHWEISGLLNFGVDGNERGGIFSITFVVFEGSLRAFFSSSFFLFSAIISEKDLIGRSDVVVVVVAGVTDCREKKILSFYSTNLKEMMIW